MDSWRRVGRFVKKGEKGIAILAPIIARRREADDADSASVLGFRAAYVFDVSQTDGMPLPEAAEASGDPGPMTAALKLAIAAQGVALEYDDHLGDALGFSCGGRIRVLNGLSPASEFSVLAHEFAHELLHRGADRPGSRDTRELEAEAVAFVVGQAVGLENADAARDYIHLYGGDREALIASLQRIQQTASSILRWMNTAQDEAGERLAA